VGAWDLERKGEKTSENHDKMLMGCAWTELRVEGLMNLKQSPGIDESR